MQSYKTLITKRYFGRIKVRHIASASVGADVCVGRCGTCLITLLVPTNNNKKEKSRTSISRFCSFR